MAKKWYHVPWLTSEEAGHVFLGGVLLLAVFGSATVVLTNRAIAQQDSVLMQWSLLAFGVSVLAAGLAVFACQIVPVIGHWIETGGFIFCIGLVIMTCYLPFIGEYRGTAGCLCIIILLLIPWWISLPIVGLFLVLLSILSEAFSQSPLLGVLMASSIPIVGCFVWLLLALASRPLLAMGSATPPDIGSPPEPTQDMNRVIIGPPPPADYSCTLDPLQAGRNGIIVPADYSCTLDLSSGDAVATMNALDLDGPTDNFSAARTRKHLLRSLACRVTAHRKSLLAIIATVPLSLALGGFCGCRDQVTGAWLHFLAIALGAYMAVEAIWHVAEWRTTGCWSGHVRYVDENRNVLDVVSSHRVSVRGVVAGAVALFLIGGGLFGFWYSVLGYRDPMRLYNSDLARHCTELWLNIQYLAGAPAADEAAVAPTGPATEILASWRQGQTPNWTLSPNGRCLAYIESRGPKHRVVLDGRPDKEYAQIGWNTIVFSPDGAHAAYVGEEAGLWCVVVDGTERGRHQRVQPVSSLGPAPRLTGYATSRSVPLVFSTDGRRVAYVARQGEQAHAVIDGVLGRPYDSVDALGFSPDGVRSMYLAKRGGKAFVVIDGIQRGPYDEIHSPMFSPGRAKTFFIGKTGQREIANWGTWGWSSHECDRVTVLPGDGSVFSNDGQHTTFGASSGLTGSIVFDDHVLRTFDDGGLGSVAFSPDGNHLAYSQRKAGKWSVVQENMEHRSTEEGPGFDRIGALHFSPEGRKMAYRASSGDDWFVVLDGAAGKHYAEVGPPTFSPDGRRLAYYARPTRTGGTPSGAVEYVIVVDDAESDVKSSEVGQIAFSPDSRHVGVPVRSGQRWSVLLNGKRVGDEYTSITWNGRNRVAFASPHWYHHNAVRDSGEVLEVLYVSGASE